MEHLMLDDEALEIRDGARFMMIGMAKQALNTPSRQFMPNYGGARDFPINEYPEGARFNVGLDVFKIISYRTRGKRPSMVVRFDGTLNP
jgi:hypothetical protein